MRLARSSLLLAVVSSIAYAVLACSQSTNHPQLVGDCTSTIGCGGAHGGGGSSASTGSDDGSTGGTGGSSGDDSGIDADLGVDAGLGLLDSALD